MMRPTEKMRRMYFDNDEHQKYLQVMYAALAICEPNQQDVRLLFIQARLFRKLEKFTVADEAAPPLTIRRRHRRLPPYPGHPMELDLMPKEMALLEVCLQLVPWPTVEDARAAAQALEFMDASELVDVPLGIIV